MYSDLQVLAVEILKKKGEEQLRTNGTTINNS